MKLIETIFFQKMACYMVSMTADNVSTDSTSLLLNLSLNIMSYGLHCIICIKGVLL